MTRDVSRAVGYTALLVLSMSAASVWFDGEYKMTIGLFALGALVAETVIPGLLSQPTTTGFKGLALAGGPQPENPRWRSTSLVRVALRVLVAALLMGCGITLMATATSLCASAKECRK